MITLVTNSAAFEQRVRRAFGNELNGELKRWHGDIERDSTRAVIDLTGPNPEVIAVGPDLPIELALELATKIDENRPEISVVIVTEPSPDLYESALRAGVRDVLAPNTSEKALRAALERAIEANRRNRRVTHTPETGPGPAGRVITVVAPKGGSGKTAIAANLSVGLAQSAPGKVVLVDLDLQFGDITNALGLEPEQTIADATKTASRLDPAMVKAVLTPWNDQLYVLCAPDDPGAGEEIAEAQLHEIVTMLSYEFEYVVIDTPAGIAEGTLAALEHTTDLVLVCDLSVAAVRSMRKLVDALDQLELTDAERLFVLNRADSKVGVKLSEVGDATGIPFDVRVPSTRAVPLSLNQGSPLVASSPRSAFSRSILDAVHRLKAKGADEESRPRWRLPK